MQQPVPSFPHNRYSIHAVAIFPTLLLLALILVCFTGCGENAPTNAAKDKAKDKPFANTQLALSCPDTAFADAIEPILRSWEVRTGAKVALRREPMIPADDCDCAVISTSQLGEWAQPGLLLTLPGKYRSGEHAMQWFTLLPAYSERLISWGGDAFAVPLTGDGHVLVYRADRFADPATKTAFEAKYKRSLTVPNTWEDFATVATFFAERDQKPSLPALPSDNAKLFELFCRVAACFDRPALSDNDLNTQQSDKELLAFQFTIETGQPRWTSPGFRTAAEWFAGLHTANCFSTTADEPAKALAENRAVMAVLSLDQLAKLPREAGAVPARFAVANLPHSRFYLKGEKRIESPGGNYIPFFSGGRLGVVRNRSANAEAAFELLAELATPARTAEYIATPGLGAGPTRVSHLDRDRFVIWLSYGLNTEQSQNLQDAMRYFVGQSVKNPTYNLRAPDSVTLNDTAGATLRKLANRKPIEILGELQTEWQKIGVTLPPATRLQIRQRDAGLN
jgi:ABC-type glycerol-3-phosphate transport system substrate-binding protein